MKSFSLILFFSFIFFFSQHSQGDAQHEPNNENQSCSESCARPKKLEAVRNIVQATYGTGTALGCGYLASLPDVNTGGIAIVCVAFMLGVEVFHSATNMFFGWCGDDSFSEIQRRGQYPNVRSCLKARREFILRSGVRQLFFWTTAPTGFYLAYENNDNIENLWYIPGICYVAADAISLGVSKAFHFRDKIKNAFGKLKNCVCRTNTCSNNSSSDNPDV